MKIVFLEAESRERELFTRALAGHEVSFLDGMDEVPPETEILSGFICTQITPPFLETHPALRFVATRTTTIDHIDLKTCLERGIKVSYVPMHGYVVAEHTLALMLSLARRLKQSAEARGTLTHFAYEAIRGLSLRGKTLGVIGAGRIGLQTIQLTRNFGMEVLAYDPEPNHEAAAALDFTYAPLEQLLRRAHIVTLHATLNKANRHLLNRRTFAKMRRGVLIINTARGSLIDAEALLQALDSGHVAGAALDVVEDECLLRSHPEKIIGGQIVEHMHTPPPEGHTPDGRARRIHELEYLMRNNALIAHPSVLYTPHCSFNTTEAVDEINTTTLANIRAFIAGRHLNAALSNS